MNKLKRLAIAGAASAILLGGMAVPALASGPDHVVFLSDGLPCVSEPVETGVTCIDISQENTVVYVVLPLTFE